MEAFLRFEAAKLEIEQKMLQLGVQEEVLIILLVVLCNCNCGDTLAVL